jgi:hypothetical protein
VIFEWVGSVMDCLLLDVLIPHLFLSRSCLRVLAYYRLFSVWSHV